MNGYTGPLNGLGWGWWRGQKRKRVDPYSLILADTPVHNDIVAAYRSDEDRPSSDTNDVCVVETLNGERHVLDGKHRTLAARSERRPLWVRYAREHDNPRMMARRSA